MLDCAPIHLPRGAHERRHDDGVGRLTGNGAATYERPVRTGAVDLEPVRHVSATRDHWADAAGGCEHGPRCGRYRRPPNKVLATMTTTLTAITSSTMRVNVIPAHNRGKPAPHILYLS